jgi:hypothetical protein
MGKIIENKWILSSCLQKSIRKGFCQLALQYFHELWDYDSHYAIHILSLVGIEDIGIANIDLLNDFLNEIIDIKINTTQKINQEKMIFFVEKFCNSVKDRSIYDLNLLSVLSENQNIEDLEKNYIDIFLNHQETIVNRFLAGWKILESTKIKNPLIAQQEKEKNFESFLHLYEKILPNQNMIELMRKIYTIYESPYGIGLGLLFYLYQEESKNQEKVGKYQVGDFVQNEYSIRLIQNKWLIDGIDWHTKEGKLAIAEFCKENINLKKLNFSEDILQQLVGLLFFRCIGQQLDKRLVYPSAVVIMKMAEQKAINKLILSDQYAFSDLMIMFKKDLHILYEKIEKKMNIPDPELFPF